MKFSPFSSDSGSHEWNHVSSPTGRDRRRSPARASYERQRSPRHRRYLFRYGRHPRENHTDRHLRRPHILASGIWMILGSGPNGTITFPRILRHWRAKPQFAEGRRPFLHSGGIYPSDFGNYDFHGSFINIAPRIRYRAPLNATPVKRPGKACQSISQSDRWRRKSTWGYPAFHSHHQRLFSLF